MCSRRLSEHRLAASEDPFGVTLGGILGHMVCTGAAVLGGRHLATHIDEKTVGVSIPFVYASGFRDAC